MNNFLNYSTLVIFFAVLMSCEKSDPIEHASTPVFYASGTIDGEPFSWHAGEDNLYMHSNFLHDTHSVFSFRGALAPSNCETADCPNSLHFYLRDANFSTSNQEANAEEVLQPGNFAWRSLNDSAIAGYRVKLSAEEFYTGDQYTYAWTTSNGLTSTERYPEFIFPADWEGAVEICLAITNNSGCTDNLCYDVFPASTCDLDFDYYVINNVCFLFAEPRGGKAPYNFQWEFGQNHDPLSAQVKYELNSFTPSKKICLTTIDANGCIAEKCKNVIINSSAINCASNFLHSKEELYRNSDEDFSEATIVWYNENGERFSSALSEQTDDAFFTIHEVEEYHQNVQGELTSKAKITFSCVLYNQDLTRQVHFEDVEATVAIAHP